MITQVSFLKVLTSFLTLTMPLKRKEVLNLDINMILVITFTGKLLTLWQNRNNKNIRMIDSRNLIIQE